MPLIIQTHEMFHSWNRAGYACRYLNVSTARQHTYWCTVFKSFCTNGHQTWQVLKPLMCASPACFCALLFHAGHIGSHASTYFVVLWSCYSSEFLFFSSTAPETTARVLCDPTDAAVGKGKEQSRGVRCTGMVGSCRFCRKNSLFRVCISGVEGRARSQGSWHPKLQYDLQVRCTISSIASKTEWDVNSPIPAPLQTSEKLHLQALTEQMPAGVISSHSESPTEWAEHSSWTVTQPPTSELWQPVPIKLLSDHDHFLLTFFNASFAKKAILAPEEGILSKTQKCDLER